MPDSGKAKSVVQQRLMGMALACKRGDIDCDGEVKKLANSMSSKSLSRFAKTKHKGLPHRVKEGSMVFKVNKEVDKTELIDWLNKNEVEFEFYNDEVLYLDEDTPITEDEIQAFNNLIEKHKMIQMEIDEDLATLSNTVGLGYINPPMPSTDGNQPGNSSSGSGDRFDNGEDEDDEYKKLKKKMKNRKILSYDEVMDKKHKTNK